MNDTSEHSNYQITWEKIIETLILPRKRLRLRIVDTVFLQSINDECQVTAWYLTTKKGETTKRKGSGLILQHVCDRFSRIALTGSNTVGPRIVAVGYLGNRVSGKRINFTVEQLEREAKSCRESHLARCTFLQCYLKPSHDSKHHFTGVYSSQYESSSSPEREDKLKREVLTYCVEEPMIDTDPESDVCSTKLLQADTALLKWIQKEVDVSTMKIVQALESVITLQEKEREEDSSSPSDGRMLSSLTAYFVLDNDKRLWLTYVNNVAFNGDDTWPKLLSVDSDSKNDQGSFLPRLNNKDKHPFPQKTHKRGRSMKKNNRIINDLEEHEEPQHPKKEERSHSDEMVEEISRLKKELDLKSRARDGCVSDINKLRSSVKSVLDLDDRIEMNEFNGNEQGAVEEQIEDPRILRQECKKLLLEKSDAFGSSLAVAGIEKELEIARDENKILQSTIADRGHHDRIISKLQKQCNELSKKLGDELFRKNEARRRMESKVKEVTDVLEKSKDRVYLLELDLNNEKSRNEKVLEQVKTANKVLESELKSQREFVEEIREASWSDLATKIRVGIEAVTSQELAKSSIGATQAVSACEERWKRRLVELNSNHMKEISALSEDHKNEVRYKHSQFQIHLEQGRAEVEDRLQNKHTEALRATLNHKESQRQIDIKHEIKRWEQMMSEMKARIHSEHQQTKQRLLKEKDEYWKFKMEQEAKIAEAKLENGREEFRLALQATLAQNEKDMNFVLIRAEEENKVAVDMACLEAEDRWKEAFKEKELEIDAALQKEKNEMADERETYIAANVNQAVEDERQRTNDSRETIAKLKADHGEEIKKLLGVIEENRKKTEALKKILAKQHESQVIEDMEQEIEKMKGVFESRLAEINSIHITDIAVLKAESNKTIAAQLDVAKQQSTITMEDAIAEIEVVHEEQVQSFEYEIGWLKTQKETSDASLVEARNRMQQQYEVIEATEEERRAERVEHSYYKLYMVTKALQLKQNLRSKSEINDANIDQIRSSHQEVEYKFKSQIEKLQKRTSKLEGNLKLISSTLLNHKRDALVEHKMKSRQIATDISEISQKIEAAEAKQQKMNSHIDSMVHAMYDVEKQLQEHSQTSALQGGKVDISHTRKKRRLDEEYEQILCKIELKRDGLNAVDDETRMLHAEKAKANDDMRKLEKSLVELLVDQQKTLLSISSRN